MHTVFALLCFVVVIHWLIFPYPSGLLNWHCGNLTIAPVPAKQPWWIWINTSCEFIVNDCITPTKQSTTKPCAYFLGYTVFGVDVELNPDPSVYPCGYCLCNVSWNGYGLCRDNCDMWFHPSCIDIPSAEYCVFGQTNVEWKCFRCHTINSSCLMYHSYEVDTHNRVCVLSCAMGDSLFHNDTSPPSGTAQWHSCPQTLHSSSERKFPSILTLRSMTRSNCGFSHRCDPNSEVHIPIKRKIYEHFLTANAYVILARISYCLLKPKLITKFLHLIFVSQLKSVRKGLYLPWRRSMIAIRDNLVAEEVDMVEVSTEVIWVKIIP